MNHNFVNTLSRAVLVLVAAGGASSAFADTEWERSHRGRDQVEDRLDNQNKRINEEVREGDMSQGQAQQLRRKDQRILREERGMAYKNNGHITKEEQHELNQQENGVSQQIGK